MSISDSLADSVEAEGSLLLNGDAQSCPHTSPLWKHHGKAQWFSKKWDRSLPKLYISAKNQDPLCQVGGPYEKKNITNFLYIISKKKSIEQFKKISHQIPPHQWLLLELPQNPMEIHKVLLWNVITFLKLFTKSLMFPDLKGDAWDNVSISHW